MGQKFTRIHTFSGDNSVFYEKPDRNLQGFTLFQTIPLDLDNALWRLGLVGASTRLGIERMSFCVSKVRFVRLSLVSLGPGGPKFG